MSFARIRTIQISQILRSNVAATPRNCTTPAFASTVSNCVGPSCSSNTAPRAQNIQTRYFSESINYSGGQANSGQGGYYGSGGARAKAEATSTANITQEQRSKMIALESDVEIVHLAMEQLEELEELLRDDQEFHEGKVSDRSVELRGKIRAMIANKDFLESLDRLEIEGSPVWGLSSDEYDMVCMAREKLNAC